MNDHLGSNSSFFVHKTKNGLLRARNLKNKSIAVLKRAKNLSMKGFFPDFNINGAMSL